MTVEGKSPSQTLGPHCTTVVILHDNKLRPRDALRESTGIPEVRADGPLTCTVTSLPALWPLTCAVTPHTCTVTPGYALRTPKSQAPPPMGQAKRSSLSPQGSVGRSRREGGGRKAARAWGHLGHHRGGVGGAMHTQSARLGQGCKPGRRHRSPRGAGRERDGGRASRPAAPGSRLRLLSSAGLMLQVHLLGCTSRPLGSLLHFPPGWP